MPHISHCDVVEIAKRARYALAWAQGGIVAAGPDKTVMVYDSKGRVSQTFDYSRTAGEREPTCAAANPGGYCVAVAGYDGLSLSLSLSLPDESALLRGLPPSQDDTC